MPKDKEFDPFKPSVGMGVTNGIGSDCYPYTIVEVRSEKQLVVKADDYQSVGGDGMSAAQEYIYGANTKNPAVVLTLRKNGAWKQKGELMRGGSNWHIGSRRAYRDPSF